MDSGNCFVSASLAIYTTESTHEYRSSSSSRASALQLTPLSAVITFDLLSKTRLPALGPLMTTFSGSAGLGGSITADGANAGDFAAPGRASSGIEGGSLRKKGLPTNPSCSVVSGAEGVGVVEVDDRSRSAKSSPSRDLSSSPGVRGGEGDGVSFMDDAFEGVRA